MRPLNLVVLLAIFLSVACKQPVDKSTPAWDYLTIVSERSTKITIGNDRDSSIVKIYHNGSFFSPLPKGEKVKVDTVKVFFTKAEKDTVFSLVNDLIVHPVATKRSCTEFVGKLELSINYGQFQQSGTYTSVCDWTQLSDKTQHLHMILKRKLKNIYLGENSNLR